MILLIRKRFRIGKRIALDYEFVSFPLLTLRPEGVVLSGLFGFKVELLGVDLLGFGVWYCTSFGD